MLEFCNVWHDFSLSHEDDYVTWTVPVSKCISWWRIMLRRDHTRHKGQEPENSGLETFHVLDTVWGTLTSQKLSLSDQTSRSADHSRSIVRNAELPSSHHFVLRLISYNKDPSCRRLLLCTLNTTPPGPSQEYELRSLRVKSTIPLSTLRRTISMIRSPHCVQPGYNNQTECRKRLKPCLVLWLHLSISIQNLIGCRNRKIGICDEKDDLTFLIPESRLEIVISVSIFL